MATLPSAQELTAGRLSAWCATGQAASPLTDVLAAWGMLRPSGVLLLEALPHEDPNATWAFVLFDGQICGAQGPGAMGDLSEWLPERCRRSHIDIPRFDAAHDALSLEHPVLGPLAAQFVRERFLDQMLACNRPGARAALYIGGLAWHDHILPARFAPSLDHAILENARRTDEYPGLMATLGELDHVPTPARPPATTMAANLAELEALRGDTPNLGWDFVDQPDHLANEEWQDVRSIFELVDGQRALEDIIQASMLGRYRTTAALGTLARCGNIVLPSTATAGANDETNAPTVDAISDAFASSLEDDDELAFEASSPLVDLDDDDRTYDQAA